MPQRISTPAVTMNSQRSLTCSLDINQEYKQITFPTGTTKEMQRGKYKVTIQSQNILHSQK